MSCLVQSAHGILVLYYHSVGEFSPHTEEGQGTILFCQSPRNPRKACVIQYRNGWKYANARHFRDGPSRGSTNLVAVFTSIHDHEQRTASPAAVVAASHTNKHRNIDRTSRKEG